MYAPLKPDTCLDAGLCISSTALRDIHGPIYWEMYNLALSRGRYSNIAYRIYSMQELRLNKMYDMSYPLLNIHVVQINQ